MRAQFIEKEKITKFLCVERKDKKKMPINKSIERRKLR